MAKDKKPIKKKVIEQYEHKDKQRLNNPPVGLVDAETDKEWIIS
jgi:adenine-specific DNA-methyltransferase